MTFHLPQQQHKGAQMGYARNGDVKEIPASKQQILPLRKNDIRALICFAVAATIVADIAWSAPAPVSVITACLLLFYTLFSYFVLKKNIRSTKNDELCDKVTTLDAAMLGAALSISGINLLPTILFVVMIQFNSLFNGGVKKWATDNIALACGIALTFLFHRPVWFSEGPMEISFTSLIAVFTYFCAYALYAHKQLEKLQAANVKLANEKLAYKLRTYKLARYLTPTVWKAINEGREKSLSTERKRVTVFFSDIRGFSSLSEELEAEALTDILNTYFTEMIKIVIKHKGTIDKFMGDGMMVIFGDTDSEGLKADCTRCLAMAIEMKKKMKELQARWYNQGIKKPLQIRMGINTGFCTVGSFGTSQYMDYTVLGTHVNLAARLESAALPGEILISHETWSLIKDTIICRDKGEINAKGFSHPIKVYQVVDFRKELGRNQSYFEENAEGFSMYLDLEKIRNYDKDRVIENLEKTIERIRDKIIS